VLTGEAEEGGARGSGEVRPAGRSCVGCVAASVSSYGHRRGDAPERAVVLLLALLLLLRCGDGDSGEPEAARVCGCGCGSLYGALGLERLGAAAMPWRPCHGHMARIRRLRREIKVCGAGGRGAGKRERARAVTVGCHEAGRRGRPVTQAGAEVLGKRGSCGYGSLSRSGATQQRGASGGRVLLRASGGREKLTGGARASAAPREGEGARGGASVGGLGYCCWSKPTGEQRQATRGAGRLPGLLVGPCPSVNGPEVRHTPWLGETPRSKQPELNMYLNTRKQSLVKIHYTSGATVIHSFI
jgi:hypothetical protein